MKRRRWRRVRDSTPPTLANPRQYINMRWNPHEYWLPRISIVSPQSPQFSLVRDKNRHQIDTKSLRHPFCRPETSMICSGITTSLCGIVSLQGVTEDGASVEVAMSGRDSVIGFPGIVRKNETAFRAQVQVAGEAFRVGARVLQVALKQESEIYIPLLDHTHTLSEQIAQAAVCNQFHTADQRLARWLLLAPCDTERSPEPRESETLTDCLCQVVMAIYEREQARLGSHSAAALRLGIRRTTLYDWLEWARQHMTK